MKEPTEILTKIPEYRSIEYAPDFVCPECDNSGIGIAVIGRQKPSLVGWCETTYGYMVVLECPSCFTKFRIHGALIKDDLEAFNADIYKYYLGGGDADLAWVSNAIELYKKVKGE